MGDVIDEDDDLWCFDRSEYGYICGLPINHDGAHLALGEEDELCDSWGGVA